MEQTFVVKRSTPEHIHLLGEMLDTVYRPKLQPGQGMPREFPHLFSPDNAENMYYVDDAGRPVSLVGVKKQEVVFQGVTMKVASIGCVATVPAYQGRHISSHILNRVIQDLTDERIPLMLVSGDRGLYRRVHCVPVGQMFEALINVHCGERLAGNTDSSSNIRLTEVSEAKRSLSAHYLAPIYRRQAYRYRRTTEQMAVLLNALWFQRASHDQRLFEIAKDGTVVGYVVAFVSSGAPGTVEVLEWAGSQSAVLSAIHSILRAYDAERLVLRVHREDFDTLSQIKEAGGEVGSTPLQGTFRILNVEAFFDSIKPLLLERFGGEARVHADDGTWTVSLPHVEKSFTEVESMMRWVFGQGDGCLDIPFVHTDDLNYI